jgi:hypothetical protein
VIDTATGQAAYFISAGDLIALKLASGRPQDLADVAAVRKAQESRNPKPPGKSRGDTPESDP